MFVALAGIIILPTCTVLEVFTGSPYGTAMSKLLTYCVLRPTQPPTLSGTGNEYYGYGVKA